LEQQDSGPKTNIKIKAKMAHWAQNQASAMAIPVPDLNPIENEWSELKRRSTNIMDLGI